MKNIILTLLCISTFSQTIFAISDLDLEITQYVERFNYKAVTRLSVTEQAKFDLGKKLFFDQEISGNRNISCATCHAPEFGTGDGLMVSIGQGGVGDGDKRVVTASNQLTPRHSPNLYNIGHDNLEFMFWDGRVRYSHRLKEFTTPEPGLNGDNPEYFEIAELLESSLAAQALFPITSDVEMRGHGNENELSSSKSNLEIWQKVMKRLLSHKDYAKMFKEAFGEVEFNIAHYANALAYFQKYEFQVTNTPFDRYLRGDTSALSDREKRGLIAFSTSGLCANCHNGELLGGIGFFNVVAPQAGPGKDIKHNDEGLFYTTQRDAHKYMFKIPMLRNVSKTAPYFHSGVYQDLRAVIEHYASGMSGIDNYDSKVLEKFEKNNYKEKMFVETDRYMIFRKKNNAHPIIKGQIIRLTESEKDDLELFLTKSLTEN